MKKTIFFVGILGIGLSLSAQNNEVILQKIDNTLQKMRADWESPGMAVAIVKDDSVIFAKGYGAREMGKPQKVDECTLFAVGSQTKSFTAAALAILVDEGKLKWDDPVVKYLPQFQLRDPELTRRLTIRDCLTHRTGFDSLSVQFLFSDMNREEILQRYRYAKPVGGFRSSFEYNNILFLLAGEIIPAVTGMSWDDFVTERIFKPLQMKASNTSIARTRAEANVASSHEMIDGKIRNVPLLNVDNYAPAGSINSNLVDMAQWLRMQLGQGMVDKKRIISDTAIAEMHSPQVMVAFPRIFMDMPVVFAYPILRSKPLFLTYGLGWFIQEYRGKKLIHHGGDIEGQRCQTGFIPEMNLGVVVFSNLHPATLVEAVLFTVADAFIGGEGRDWSGELLAAIREYRVRTAAAQSQRPAALTGRLPPSTPFEKFSGQYESEAYGPARVAYENGGLVLHLGRLTASLKHSQGNAFFIDTYSLLNRIPITFLFDKNGNAEEMRMFGITEFKRVAEK